MKRHPHNIFARLSVVLMFAALAAFALAEMSLSQVPAPAKPLPVLSTAEKLALQALVEKESDLQKNFQLAEQGKSQIIAEFSNEHPGFHLDPRAFTVVADVPKPEAKKDAPKPAVTPAVKK